MARIEVKRVKLQKKKAGPYKSPAAKEAEKLQKRLRSGKAAKTSTAKSSSQRVSKGTTFKLKKFESLGVRALPETPFTRKGMTLKQLIRSTPRLFINNAVDVEARKFKKLTTQTGKPVLQGVMWTNDPFRPDRVRRFHEAYIVGLDENQEKPIHKHRRVLAQCQCENYVYVFEYANATVGAARLLYSNGEPPAYTNPALMPGLCIGENELVFTSAGAKKIKDVKVGDSVITMGKPRKVTAAWKSGTKETVRLRTRGSSVRLTRTHLVYGVVDGQLDWHEAQKFKHGDFVVSILQSGFGEQKFDPALAKVLGYMIAEGSHTYFSNMDAGVNSDFLSACRKTGVVANALSTGEGACVAKHSLRFLRSVGLTQGSYNHEVPAYLFSASRDEVVAFLQGLYAGDGYITNRVSTYGSASGKLVRGIQVLLNMLGVRTALQIQKESGVNGIKMYLLRTSSAEETGRLVEAIDPVRRNRMVDKKHTAVPAARDFIPFDVNAHILNLEESDCSFNSDADLVRYIDLCASFGFCPERFRKQAMPFFEKVRDRVGGKPTNYIKVSDFLAITLQARLKKQLVEKGWTLMGVRAYKAVNKWRKSKLIGLGLSGKPKSFVNRIVQDRLVFDPVLHVGHPKVEDVYDLEVDKAHHFVVNGLVVHNCKHLIRLAKIAIEHDL